MSPTDPVSFYLPLLASVERKPIQALKDWLQRFPDTGWTSETVLRNYRRGLKRLIAQARRSVATEHVGELEQLIRLTLEKARKASAANYGPGSAAYGGIGEPVLSREAVLDANHGKGIPGVCPPDLYRLAERAAAWKDEDWCSWLADGFTAINGDHPRPHLAFAPLRLYPVGRYVNQLGAALAEGDEANLDLKARVIGAVWTHLESGKSSCDPVPLLDGYFWRLIRHLNAEDRPAAAARLYVNRQQGSLQHQDFQEKVLPSLFDAVWKTSPAPRARASFFEWLTERVSGSLQDAWLVVALINEAASQQILSRDEAFAVAATHCLRIIRRSAKTIHSPLEELIIGGKLDAMVNAQMRRPISSVAGLIEILDELAFGEDDSSSELPIQPTARPLRDLRIFDVMGNA